MFFFQHVASHFLSVSLLLCFLSLSLCLTRFHSLSLYLPFFSLFLSSLFLTVFLFLVIPHLIDITNYIPSDNVSSHVNGRPVCYDTFSLLTDSSDTRLSTIDESQSYRNMINVDKKDYSILPPAAEWCRMMGFRQCGKGRSRR